MKLFLAALWQRLCVHEYLSVLLRIIGVCGTPMYSTRPVLSFKRKTYTWRSRKSSYFWFTQWEYPDKAKEKHMKSTWKAYKKRMKSVWKAYKKRMKRARKAYKKRMKSVWKGIVTLCFQKLTSWAVWIANLYDVITSRCNVMPWCNVKSWYHVHGDRCLQTPIVSDYQFNLFQVLVGIFAWLKLI